MMKAKEPLFWYCATCGGVRRATGATERFEYLPCLDCHGTEVAIPLGSIEGKNVHCAACGLMLPTSESIIEHLGE